MAEWNGQIAFIQIAPKATEKLTSVPEVRAVAAEGLEGDRYFKKIGTYSDKPGGGRQVTLVELESVEALKRDLKIELEPTQTRRNIVTWGVPLNHLVGRQFRLGRSRASGREVMRALRPPREPNRERRERRAYSSRRSSRRHS